MILVRVCLVYLVFVPVLMMFSTSGSWAQAAAQPPCVRSFLSGLVGEWVGTFEQSADEGEPDLQYFHVILKKLDDSSYEGEFQFFRQGENGLSACGETCVVTRFDENGAAVSTIKGSGKVMVLDKLTDQRHELTETLSYSDCGSLQSKGTGSISLSGMPLGLGKHGNVKASESVWSVKDDVLTIDQKMSVSFKALIISKTVDVQAHYEARRGSDVSLLLNRKTMELEPRAKLPEATSPAD